MLLLGVGAIAALMVACCLGARAAAQQPGNEGASLARWYSKATSSSSARAGGYNAVELSESASREARRRGEAELEAEQRGIRTMEKAAASGKGVRMRSKSPKERKLEEL